MDVSLSELQKLVIDREAWRAAMGIAKSDTTERLNWTELIAQLVKNLPVMQETQVPFLVWEDPTEKEMATHSSILA